MNSIQNLLDQRIIEISDFFEISQTLNSSLNLKSVLDNILLTSMGKMMISKGFVMLSKNGSDFEIATGKGIQRDFFHKTIHLIKLPQNLIKVSNKETDENFTEFLESAGIEILVPIYSRSSILGILCYGKKLIKNYTEQDLEFLESLANIAGTAIKNSLVYEELRVSNNSLDKKIQELNTLFDISSELNSTLDEAKILKLMSYVVMGQTLVNVFVVAHTVGDSLQIVFRNSVEEIDFPEIVKSQISNLKKPACSNELCKEAKKWFSENKFLLAVPMLKNGEVHGAILLGNKLDNSDFLEEDLNFLTTLSNIAVTALENARLFAETIEKQKIEEELALARKIQEKLLPQKLPAVNGFDIFGMNISSKQVGGDYYDFIKLDENRFLLTIADVSGKGSPASLIMATLYSAIRAMIDYAQDLKELTEKLNTLIFDATDYDKFVTFFVCILDTKTGELEYVNAGHNPPYLVRENNKIIQLDKGGTILGVIRKIDFESEKITLANGDLFFAFTDGIIEALDAEEEEFGEERLKTFLIENKNLEISEISKKIVRRIAEFTNSDLFADDITLISILKKGK